MTVETFFANFEYLVNAPNGVRKLRELILQLAVQGKLVQQDPEDEPASVLLERIEAEKKRLVKGGKITKLSAIGPGKAEDQPFVAPKGWEWPRLDSICSYIQRGKGPQYVDKSDIPVVSQKCIQWGGFTLEPARFICPTSLSKYAEERFLQTGDLLWNSTGTGTIGRINVYVHEGNPFELVVADSHVTVVRPVLVNSRYLWIWLASPFIQADLEGNASGSTNQVELATSVVKAHVVPLPPLDEQKRIVAKVDQLMALCGKLEARQQKQHQGRARLNNATLAALLAAREPDEFVAHWQRISTNFDILYDHPETIPKLRASILQLAVQGKLAPQDPKDEPASVLLERIKAEKERLVKEGEIRSLKPMPRLKSDEHYVQLPTGWKLVRVGELGKTQTGTTPSRSDKENIGTFIPFIGPGDIKNYQIDYTGQGLSEKGLENGRLIEKGSVMMVCIGGSIGKHAINVRDVSCNQQINTITPFLRDMVTYLFLAMGTEMFQRAVIDEATGSATPIINKQKWSSILVPIPPEKEQKRIVAKVEQLMALCDDLEAKLNQARQHSEKLIETAVGGLLAS